VQDEKTGEWRYPNRDAGEKPEIRCMLVGYIPFEFIESVDWQGDEYYGFPHIYCHFDGPHGQPYEKMAFCEQRDLNGLEYWTELAEFNQVRKLTKRRGIKTMW
jgi:hypothetical protein